MNPGRPVAGEYLDYFDTYISLVPDEDIVNAMKQQAESLRTELTNLPGDQLEICHDPYTWTIKQVVGHMIDTERVFAYRAARFAAGDSSPLPGFDQDAFVAETDYNACNFIDLVNELAVTRDSSVLLFARQNTETWMRSGTADGKLMSVRAAAYTMVGHIRYHMQIIHKRLGIN